MADNQSSRAAQSRRVPRPTEDVRRLRHYHTSPVPIPVITRVSLKNYKSIAACSVDLSALSLIVGPNGSGKSNFLDGIRLTVDALRSTLEYALRERGGVAEVRRRSRGHPTHFGIRFDLAPAEGWRATFAYQIAARRGANFDVQREECWITHESGEHTFYVVEGGVLKQSSADQPYPVEVSPDRLYLQVVSAYPYFSRLFQIITSCGFYNLNLGVIRELQDPNLGDLLLPDGANLGAVIRRVHETSPKLAHRVEQYLAAVVPGVKGISAKSLGPKDTIEVRQEVAGDPNPWRYLAANVSDGTLRALGVLVAAFQSGTGRRAGIPFIAIEEPEIAIHPGAAVKLMDALIEASASRQLLITTHSPDLLDHPDIRSESILAVESQKGNTIIGPIAEKTRTALRANLYTVGELLRLEQVTPNIFEAQAKGQQLRLFGPAA